MHQFENVFMRNFKDNPGWQILKYEKLLEATLQGSGQYGFYFIDE
jgi:hypothetical protein